MGSERVTVVSPVGEIVRKIPFKKPDPRAVATKIYPAGGMLVVVLNVQADSKEPFFWRRLLVIDESTSKVVGYYQPPGLNWSDVCLPRDQQMMFLIVDNNKQSMATARIW